MRRKFYFIVFLGFLSLNSCENENQEVLVESASNLLSEAEIKDIGIKHNEALDYIFKELSSQENSQTKSSIDIENIIKAGLTEYCTTIFTGEEFDNAIKYSNKAVENYFGKRKVKSSEIGGLHYNPSILDVIKENKDQFSKAQIKYLLQCESIYFSDKVTDIDILMKKLESLENSIKNELTDEEAQIVMIYLEVAKASIQYWNENFLKWDGVLSESKTKGLWSDIQSKEWWNEVWRVTKEIAVYDAVGAGLTASATFAWNLIPGVGQATYGFNVFAGAAVSSGLGAYEIAKNYDCEYVMKIPVTISSVLKDDDNLCMVNVNDLSLIETYSDDNIDLTNVALYVDFDLYFRVAHGLEENQEIYLYAFCPKDYYGTGTPLSMHIDEIEDKSMEIKRILVGSTTYGNLKVRPQKITLNN